MAEPSTSSCSSSRTTWKRKRQLLSKVEAIAALKQRAANVGEQQESPSSQPAQGSEGPAPAMDQDNLISENSDHGVSDSEDKAAEFSQEKAQLILDDWMVSLRLDQ